MNKLARLLSDDAHIRLYHRALRRRKREQKHAAYYKAGLNGARAVARRLRQMYYDGTVSAA